MTIHSNTAWGPPCIKKGRENHGKCKGGLNVFCEVDISIAFYRIIIQKQKPKKIFGFCL